MVTSYLILYGSKVTFHSRWYFFLEDEMIKGLWLLPGPGLILGKW